MFLPIKAIFTTALVAIVFNRLALAQFGASSNLSISNMNAYLSIQKHSEMVRDAQQRLDRINQRNNSNQNAQATTRTQAQTAPQTAFSPGSQRLLVTQFARSLSNDPTIVSELTTSFTEGFRAFEEESRRLGHPNNVAMAFTYAARVF